MNDELKEEDFGVCLFGVEGVICRRQVIEHASGYCALRSRGVITITITITVTIVRGVAGVLDRVPIVPIVSIAVLLNVLLLLLRGVHGRVQHGGVVVVRGDSDRAGGRQGQLMVSSDRCIITINITINIILLLLVVVRLVQFLWVSLCMCLCMCLICVGRIVCNLLRVVDCG